MSTPLKFSERPSSHFSKKKKKVRKGQASGELVDKEDFVRSLNWLGWKPDTVG